MRVTHATFDSQAQEFDRRVGLPAEAPLEVASAVLLKSVLRQGDWLLEVGCGTGELGVALGRELASRGNGYLGFDVSRGMLEVFRGRLQEAHDEAHDEAREEARDESDSSRQAATVGVVQADGNAPWPVADGLVGAVFSSRALHLLQQEHVEEEVERVLGERGGVLLVGRVVRPKDAPGTLLRRQLHRQLRERGFEGRGGRKRLAALFDRCCRRGAALIEPVPVIRWEIEKKLGKSLDAWHRRQGLAGLDLPPPAKDEILGPLRQWAEAAFGDLDRPHSTEETYILEGVHFPAGCRPGGQGLGGHQPGGNEPPGKTPV